MSHRTITDERIMELIRSCGAFTGISQRDVKCLVSAAVVENFSRGDVVIRQGGRSRGYYIVISGALCQEMSDANGDIITVKRICAGRGVGIQSFLGSVSHSSNVVAGCKTSVILIPRASFEAIMPKKDTLSYSLLLLAAEQIEKSEMMIGAIFSLDVPGRIRFVLKESSISIQDGRALVPGKMTVQELSRMVGASRELVGRCLKDLRAGGFIELNDRGEMVLDRALLA
jgi:CRP/FNR family cyclic AMP-dependent transcriptional regulator